MNPTLSDHWLERAFRLGYFLHRDQTIAVEIAARAANKLQLAATAQSKRLYYRLTGRADSRKARSKVQLKEPHLLQRLVYAESEGFERRKEQALLSGEPAAAPARKTDLVVYFIKHLVRITSKRNSFYVTLGLSRLLYNYTTPETMELYNLVIQDPDRVHDDYYYRSRKGLLLKELKERFGSLLEIVKGVRGEQRWQPNENTGQYLELARESLLWFTPWETPCVVPSKFDPLNETINQLNFAGRHADDEHEVEVNRLHAALHPDCFARLVSASGFAAPDKRLELPQFFVSDHDGSDGSSRTPPGFSEDDRRAIDNLLAQEATRRKSASSGFYRVLVDGVHCAEIEPGHSANAHVVVDETAELIEVCGEDQEGPLLLATYLLNFNSTDSESSTITVESGQQISFTVNFLRDGSGATTGAKINVACQQRSRLGAMRSAVGRGVSMIESIVLWPQAKAWRPATALAALALLIVGVWWAWPRHQQSQPQIVQFRPSPVPTATTETPKPSPAPSPSAGEVRKDEPAPKTAPPHNSPGERSITVPAPEFAINGPRHERDEALVERSLVPDADSSNRPGPLNETRGTVWIRDKWIRDKMGTPLNEVHLVFVQAVNDNAQNQDLVEQLQARLTASDKLRFSDSDTADAALKISVRPVSSRAREKRVIAIVRAVNATGFVVWPQSRRGSSWRYVGRPDYVAARVVGDLIKDIAKAGRGSR